MDAGVTDALDERIARGDLVDVTRAPQLAGRTQVAGEVGPGERRERGADLRRQRFDPADNLTGVVAGGGKLRRAVAGDGPPAPEAECVDPRDFRDVMRDRVRA